MKLSRILYPIGHKIRNVKALIGFAPTQNSAIQLELIPNFKTTILKKNDTKQIILLSILFFWILFFNFLIFKLCKDGWNNN